MMAARPPRKPVRKPGPRRRAAALDAEARQARATGAAIARDALAARDRALAKRRSAVRRASAGPARAGVALATPARVAAAGGPRRVGVLVAEGDSWFDFPLADVLDLLEDEHGYDVESVARAGDRLEDMAYARSQAEGLSRALERVLRRGEAPRAILLSGGGNDVAGAELAMLLEHACSPEPGLNEDVVRGVLETRVRNAFITLIARVGGVASARLGAPVPVLVHGYARPVPDGRGFLGGWGPLPGPWLRPALRQKGFEDLARGRALLGDLIDRFNAMLRGVAALPGFEHVRYLDLRPELSSGGRHEDWWADELHPTKRGFRAIAARFAAAIEQR
jgi:lysophospholipase L1-like esterase